MFEYTAKITNVVDGDTVDATVDLGFDVSMSMRFRLFGVDTPEIRTRDLEEKAKGLEAKGYVEGMCLGRKVLIRSKKDKKGKYGRYLAEIFLPDSILSINQLLLKEGLAKPYR